MSSIRRHTILLLCTAIGGLLILGGIVVYFSIRSALVAQFDATLEAKAQALIVASDLDDDKIDIDFSVRDFAGFGSASQGDFFEIFGANGRSLARSPSLAGHSLPLNYPGYRMIRLPDGREGREVVVAFTPKDDGDARLGEVRVVVASYNGELAASLRSIAFILITVSLLGLGGTIVLIRMSLARGLRPLDQLAAQMREIDVTQLHRRLPAESVPDELKPVAGKVNEMLARLEEGFARERRFTSHAAHELRTPLAELKVMVELIEQWPDEFNRDHAREMLRVIAESEVLLQALSMLSRTEAGGEVAMPETFPLGPAVKELVDKAQVIGNERRITFQTSVEGENVSTAPVLWLAILQNLLSNAAAYAREGTCVEVQASPGQLAVSNEVDNLTAEDLPHLTERFWRKSESRSDRNHSGLGLSIVSACAAQLGAKCLTTLDGSRLRVSVEWKAKGT